MQDSKCVIQIFVCIAVVRAPPTHFHRQWSMDKACAPEGGQSSALLGVGEHADEVDVWLLHLPPFPTP